MRRLPLVLLIVSLLPMTGSTAFGQMRLGLKGVGAFAGHVKPKDVDGTLCLGIVTDIGTLTSDLRWELEGAYWSKSEEGAEVSLTERSMTDLVISTHVKFAFPLPAIQAKPYVGGGIGVHFIERAEDWAVG